MSINILHISDLHIEDFDSKDKLIKSRFNEPNFKSKFFDKIKDFGKNIDYVLITGDLANSGQKEEYINITTFLNEIVQELSVDINNFIICPGNHDISWDDNKLAFLQSEVVALTKKQPSLQESDAYKFHKEKFSHFTEFYEGFYNNGETFNPSKAVFRELTLNINGTDLTLCLINSCFKESFSNETHFGYIDFESLSKELTDKTKLKIGIFHHIPVVLNGSRSIENWDTEIKYLCNQHKIKIFLFGHQHISHTSSITLDKEEFIQLSVGSLGKLDTGIENSFNILTISVTKDSKKLTILKNPYQYLQHSGSYEWIHLTEKIETLKVNIARASIKDQPIPKPLVPEIETSPSTQDQPTSIALIPKVEINYRFPEKIEAFSLKILDTVKEMKLFTSGHFHWNESTRTLGLIDTYTLLSKRKSSILAKGALLELYLSNKVDSDFIIGLGQEGNMLGAFLACNLGLPYSFIPYHNRKLDYNIHEKDLNIKNAKKITIITDVICTATSILNILEERKELFSKIKKITLFSLFYISKEIRYNPQIFENKDKRIGFYTVCDKIKIEKCKYPDNEYSNCSIFCNKLEKVYTF